MLADDQTTRQLEDPAGVLADCRTAGAPERAEVEARIARARVPSWQHPPTTAERAAGE